MPLAGIGAAVADAGAFGAADVGLAAGADVAAAGAADVGAAGAFGAADAADLAAASAVPDISAGVDAGAAGLDAANATFGTFSPDLFAANTADVAAGGLGTDIGAAGLGGVADTGALTGTSADFFAGTGGDLFSGAGLGPASSGFDTGFAQPFGDVFSSTDALGNPVSASGQLSDVGSFGGGTQPAAIPGAQAGGSIGEGPIGSTATATESTAPMVSADTGVVDTGGPIQQDFSQFTTTDQGASLPTDMANRVGVTSVPTQSTTLEQAFPGASQSITGGDIGNVPTSFSAPTPAPGELSPNFLTDTGVQPTSLPNATLSESFDNQAFAAPTAGGAQFFTGTAPGDVLPATGFDTSVSAGGASPSIAAVSGAPATPFATAPTAVTAAPGVTAPAAATPAATTAAAGGGISPLTALRAGTLGVNAITAGINLSNALNQPSYPALLPASYPGSVYSPYYSSQQSGFAGTGGIAGGLAGNRLTNGLLSGQSPQQLAQEGLISPARAMQLQSTYSGIAEQYARELGVSPATLSTGVKRMIAAQALADSGLGGR
jgi:hypothetical protein